MDMRYPFNRVLASLDVLLRFATSLIVESHHSLSGAGQVGDDEGCSG
jgi:hypothetical protein